MKPILLAFITACVLAVVGACANSGSYDLETEVADLRAQVSELESKIEEVERIAGDLDDAASTLESLVADAESEVGEFSWENWQLNVPDVESAVDEVVAQAAEIRLITDELQSAVR